MWLCRATMWMSAVRSARSTGWTSAADMMKSPPGRERLGLTPAADVHEVDLGLVVEEVVVQPGDLQPMGERRVHGGRHLVLEDNRVPHDHGPVRGGGEGRPRS